MISTGTLPGEVDLQTDASRFWSFLDKPSQPGLLKLIEVWRDRNSNGGFVVGKDIPSRALSDIMCHLMVWEPIDDGHDLYVRLAGSALHRRYNCDITGKRTSEIYTSTDQAILLADFGYVLRTRTPIYRRRQIVKYGVQQALDGEIGIFPALSPDRSATWFLIGLFLSV
ncbi:MAG: PAS domain-containing protein [Alphaproteobacteria bacterium]|nr:PAS domain-containing protein [Alphaproteobacteria bacterium]